MQRPNDAGDRKPDAGLAALAEAIADGQPLDWSTLGSSAGGDDAAILADLRLISTIAHAYAQPDAPQVTSDTAGVDANVWGPLVIREKIGQGRFGDVYRAWDRRLGREVALKLLRRERGSADEAAVIDEGHLMARVRHPSVITIYGAERINGRTGLWMELVQGRTLAQEIAERGVFPADEVISVGIALCDALAAVHRAGLLHRDVKASNVMRDPDRGVVLGDFGAGLDLGGQDSGDEPRGLAGTPLYLAPELLEGAAPTPQTDLYSLGVLLFHLATGSFPVQGRSLRDVRAAHQRGERPRLASLAPDLPAPLVGIVDRAIAVTPSDRFADAAGMLQALRDCRKTESAGPPRRQGRALAIMGALILTVSVLVTMVAQGGMATAAGEPDWALVAAFDNLTNDPQLDGRVELVFERELRASPYLDVVPPERVNDARRRMQGTAGASLNESVAREIALRSGGIRVIVAGRLLSTNGEIALIANAIRPSDGAVVASVTERAASLDELATSGRRAARALRERLHEILPSLEASPAALASVTTSSLLALQQYSQAVELWNQVEFFEPWREPLQAVEGLLESAIAVDPDFASAHLLLAMTLDRRTRRSGRARTESGRAVDLAEGVTAIERQFIEGTDARLRADVATDPAEKTVLLQKAIDIYESILEAEPAHMWSYEGLALTYLLAGRPKEHVGTLLRIGNVRPDAVAWRARAAMQANRTGDPALADTLAREMPDFVSQAEVETAPTTISWVRLHRAHLSWLDDDVAEAVRGTDAVAADLSRVPASARAQFGPQLLYMYLTLGRLQQAEAVLDWIPASPEPMRFQLRALLANEREERDRLRSLLAEATAAEKAMVPSFLIQEGLIADWHHWNATRRNAPSPVPIQDGLLALSEGRLDEAIGTLDSITEREPNFMTYLQSRRALAAAWTAAGEPDRAIEVLERASEVPRRRSIGVWSLGWLWIRMRSELADRYRAANRIDEAEAVESHLRQLLSAADDDHPIKVKLG